jgi:hypothetical protein
MKDWWEELSNNPVNQPTIEGHMRKVVFTGSFEDREGDRLQLVGVYYVMGNEVTNYDYWPLEKDLDESVRDFIYNREDCRVTFR